MPFEDVTPLTGNSSHDMERLSQSVRELFSRITALTGHQPRISSAFESTAKLPKPTAPVALLEHHDEPEATPPEFREPRELERDYGPEFNQDPAGPKPTS